MNFKKLLLSSLMLATVASNSFTVPKENSIVYEHPKICTTLAILSAAALSYKYEDNFKCYYCSPFGKITLITSAVGLICSKYWIYNPKSYFESAKSNIEANKSLINFFEGHDYIEEFLVDLKMRYCEFDVPLAYAFIHTKNLIKESKLIVEWLNVVLNSDKVEADMHYEAQKMLKPFDSVYFDKLNAALLAIKEDPAFLSQMQVLEQQEAIRQMRLANALRCMR